MTKCRVSQEELLNDIKQSRSDMAEQYTEHEQKLEVYALAKLFLHGQAVINDDDGLPFTMDEFMVMVWDHDDYKAAFEALAIDVNSPMKEIITSCAHYACAVHLFGESRADELGFIK